MNDKNRNKINTRRRGFTFIEVIIVVVVLAIAAMLAVPMIGSAATMQVRSAANVIAADMEYAKSLAISRGKPFSVQFDPGFSRYRIVDEDGNVIMHPLTGEPYKVVFSSDSRLSRVEITRAFFRLTDQVTFDYLGSPKDGTGQPLQQKGEVEVSADNTSMSIFVEPVTGFISIQD